ncbi:hypothetical protein KDA_36440 [Dictyobacter alpinus]|uniref:SWIM-type domain-containing protein n=1 Tax=Dictyobacter alpinus TaxID=2014873 RepID=A0A402BA27_9CHLR|nr:SWIM zinc finger family protein [Dictyobacter alpinus]GCE28160.1 hypothetical protein KDA_36440 [Dictyobacter alpinus]
MELTITTDQVSKMALDASAEKAGKKLAVPKHWQNLGQNTQALWGECQGSALYQVRVDLTSFTTQCSCPSRKLPCKHSLGLLFLAASTPGVFSEAEPPEWVSSWLQKRAAAQKRQETLASKETQPTSSNKKASQSIDKRQAKVQLGIEQLDLWLNDLVRNGLGSVEALPATFWEQQAAQMVDAQASGLAARVRILADIPNASKTWTARLLAQLGKLALLTEAYRHLERVDSNLQEEIRQLVGWTVKEPEVLARGTHITDDWLFLGQRQESAQRGRLQRTWLWGARNQQSAYILQFSFAGAPYTEHYPTGFHQEAEMAYWPGALAQRALFVERQSTIQPIQTALPGKESFTEFLAEVASQLAQQPWQERFLCILRQAIPIYDVERDRWYLRDQLGKALPLTASDHWKLLALSGGHPVDFSGEWNGETLFPLGIVVDQHYHVL